MTGESSAASCRRRSGRTDPRARHSPPEPRSSSHDTAVIRCSDLARLVREHRCATTLAWFADDLVPTPVWNAPPADSSGWCELDGATVREHVRTLAAGLIDVGVSPGERVALMIGNRPEHWLMNLAVLHAGAVPSTFYPTLAPEQVRAGGTCPDRHRGDRRSGPVRAVVARARAACGVPELRR